MKEETIKKLQNLGASTSIKNNKRYLLLKNLCFKVFDISYNIENSVLIDVFLRGKELSGSKTLPLFRFLRSIKYDLDKDILEYNQEENEFNYLIEDLKVYLNQVMQQ